MSISPSSTRNIVWIKQHSRLTPLLVYNNCFMCPEYPQTIHFAFIVGLRLLSCATLPYIQLFLHCFAIGSDFRQFERTKTNGFLLLILMGVWHREICWGLLFSNWLWNLFLSSSSTNQWTRPLPKTLFKPWALHHHYVLRWAFSRKKWKCNFEKDF